MKAISHPEHEAKALVDPTAPPTGFVPLDRETRTCVDTKTAAYHLGRQPQTLRGHASREVGPIRAIRVGGRLAWPVAELKKALGLAE